ncbi:hypothetical protein AAE478_006247 [Parahypoxylon ruwenzoriense]
MDKLRPLGRSVEDVLLPTFAAYAPLLLPRERAIKATRRETHRYGPTPRHQLDVYYPASPRPSASSAAAPVLVWLYGGGFVSGDRVNEGFAHSVVFGNVGHFFASRFGFTVVVPDYRLLSHGAKFPSGGEDVGLAVEWIRDTLAKRDGYAAVDLFLLGNSAGGIHAATYLLAPELKGSRDAIARAERSGPGVLLRGIVFLGVPFHWGSEDNAVLRGYFGEGKIWAHSPLGLLSAEQPPPPPGVKLSILISELDPELIYDSGEDFRRAWASADIAKDVLEGHNHISPQLGLATGVEREEAWGVQVAEFCLANATKYAA